MMEIVAWGRESQRDTGIKSKQHSGLNATLAYRRRAVGTSYILYVRLSNETLDVPYLNT